MTIDGTTSDSFGYDSIHFGPGSYLIRYHIDTRRDAVVITQLWHGRERRS